MKARFLQIAVLGTLAASIQVAYADNVQIYGVIDNGIQVVNNQPKGTSYSMSSGDLAGSRIGFKGTEDLGNGLKAVFNLETGMDTSDGTQSQGRLFGRQAFVGLSDKTYGTLTLGRQSTFMTDWMSKYNAMGSTNYGIKRVDGAFSDRADNTIKYINTFGDVSVGALYSRSWDDINAAVKEDQARMIELTLRYNTKALDTGLSFYKKNALAPAAGASRSNNETRITAGFMYGESALKVSGGYRWLRQELTTNNYTSHLVWGGVNYKLKSPVTLSASVYHLKGTVCSSLNAVTCPAVQNAGSGTKATMLALGSEYAFSKRTSAYAMTAYMMNNSKSGVSLLGGNYGVNVTPGKNQFGLTVGLKHAF